MTPSRVSQVQIAIRAARRLEEEARTLPSQEGHNAVPGEATTKPDPAPPAAEGPPPEPTPQPVSVALGILPDEAERLRAGIAELESSANLVGAIW
jgi:hypothetical protein